MRKERVVISHKARASLRTYVQYLKEEVSPEVAEHVRSGVIDKCKGLKDFSGYSKERYLEGESLEYRSVPIWSYMIIYRVTDKEVRILNIVHTSAHPSIRKGV
ncbi:MAG: type II toxin-antitoxin system RelE/ParE family toxin [Bacteroidota bacterium]